MTVTSAAEATTTTTGAMIGSGGMGVTQNLYVGGNMNVLTGDVTAANLGTTRDDLCLIVCSPAGARSRSLTALCTHVGSGATGQATTTTTGALITNGGMGVVKNAYIGGILATQSTTTSASVSTGALLSAGGLDVGGAVYIGGATVITQTTQSTSGSSGALRTNGGLAVSKNMYIGGALSASNLGSCRSMSVSCICWRAS
jgi:hypothetical protein